MARPGKPLLEEARRLSWIRFRRDWPGFVGAVLVVAVTFFILTLLMPHWTREFVGAGIAAAIAIVVYGFSLGGGQTFRDGAFGERLTASAIRPLRKKGWRVAHNIPLESGDVDHGLIGPGGAIAVESKFTNAHLRISEGRILEIKWSGYTRRVSWPISAALRSARRLRLIALAAPGGIRIRVTPVVVLWGPRVERVDGGAAWIDGVLVAVGHQASEWIHLLKSEALSSDSADRAWESVIARRREHIPRAQDAPPFDALDL